MLLISLKYLLIPVQNFSVPELNFKDLEIPNFDSLAVIINEATKNVRMVTPLIPQIKFDGKNFNIEINSGKNKKKKKIEINLDSLMNLKNFISDSIRSEELKELENLNDSLSKNFNFYLNDSLLFNQNMELKKEMDDLKKELQKFREEMKNFDNKSDEQNQNRFRDTKSITRKVIGT